MRRSKVLKRIIIKSNREQFQVAFLNKKNNVQAKTLEQVFIVEATFSLYWMYKIKQLYILIKMYKLRQQAPIFQRPHDLLSVIGYALESITESRCKKNSHRTKFDTKGQPQTSFSSYLRRIYEFMKCSNSCFISALVLLDRIVEVNPVYSISSQNVHKLFMTAILVAAKMIDDQTYNQKYYSQVAGLKLSELNSLEFQFLSAISFDAFVSKENFESYVDKLENLYENNFKDMRASEREKKKNQTISNPESESQSKKGEKDSSEITVPEG